MSDYRLYCVGESGNCYKTALMLTLCGCEWEPVFVDYFQGATRADPYRQTVNELGELPVLETEGKRLTQSGVILTWLAERTGKFGGRTEDERLEILRWMLFDNHKFTSYYATLRWMVGLMGNRDPAVVEFLRARVLGAFSIVNKHLETNRYILRDRLTIADLSLIGYHYYDEETTIDRSAFPHLMGWVQRIADLPGWRHPYDLMPRGRG